MWCLLLLFIHLKFRNMISLDRCCLHQQQSGVLFCSFCSNHRQGEWWSLFKCTKVFLPLTPSPTVSNKVREFMQNSNESGWKICEKTLRLAGKIRGHLLLFLMLLCKHNSRCLTAPPPLHPSMEHQPSCSRWAPTLKNHYNIPLSCGFGPAPLFLILFQPFLLNSHLYLYFHLHCSWFVERFLIPLSLLQQMPRIPLPTLRWV